MILYNIAILRKLRKYIKEAFTMDKFEELKNDKGLWDMLRAVIENLYKAIVELLNGLGEWPIDIK